MPIESKLQRRIWKYCRERDLIRPGDTVVIGVSGGPDSLCLLDILADLAFRQNFSVQIAHLNHGLRPEASAEAEFVREQAEKRGLAYHLDTADTGAWAAAHKQSIEEAARNLRYAFLGRIAKSVRAGRVAVAHSRDDQAETVLMHFLRGSGLAGLAGMEPKRELPASAAVSLDPSEQPQPIDLIRPLLDVTRADVMAYCAEAGLAPRLDPSNLDPAYYRNRLRHALLPELETYNPNIRAILARSAEVLRGDFEWQSQAVEALWQATALPPADAGVAEFERERWLLLTDAQQRALLRQAARRLLGGLTNVGYRPIEAAVRFSRAASPGRSCQMVGGLTLEVSTSQVRLVAAALRPGGDTFHGPLLRPDGRLAAGWRLETEVISATEWHTLEQSGHARWTAAIDGEKLRLPVTVRARRPGDRFAPMGMGGHSMKLSDLMINEKVPVAQRSQWPIVVSGYEIVWVAGLRLDERFRVRADTERVLRLAFVGPQPAPEP